MLRWLDYEYSRERNSVIKSSEKRRVSHVLGRVTLWVTGHVLDILRTKKDEKRQQYRIFLTFSLSVLFVTS